MRGICNPVFWYCCLVLRETPLSSGWLTVCSPCRSPGSSPDWPQSPHRRRHSPILRHRRWPWYYNWVVVSQNRVNYNCPYQLNSIYFYFNELMTNLMKPVAVQYYYSWSLTSDCRYSWETSRSNTYPGLTPLIPSGWEESLGGGDSWWYSWQWWEGHNLREWHNDQFWHHLHIQFPSSGLRRQTCSVILEGPTRGWRLSGLSAGIWRVQQGSRASSDQEFLPF